MEFCFGVSGVTKVFPIPGAGFAFAGCAITDSWCGVLLLRGARLVLPGAGFCFCGVCDQFCLVRGLLLRCARSVLSGVGFAFAGCAISFAGVCKVHQRGGWCSGLF